MNAINTIETQAIANVATNAVAASQAECVEQDTPAPQRIHVPVSQLRAFRRNVRKTGAAGQSIEALAASIERVGLLQNLTVTAAASGEHYEVVAGGRRLAALKLLVKTKRLDAHWPVPCLLVQTQDARTVSLTENVQREAMHPADQFEAFAALVKEGRPIEDIAADFGVTPLVVQRRLRLANVSPRLMADYRADQVNLEQLMALSITDDHAAQEAAFYDAPEWQRGPHALRGRLTERDVDASHPLVRFVGLDAYETAGGSVRRDLFAEDDSGMAYLCHAASKQIRPGDVLLFYRSGDEQAVTSLGVVDQFAVLSDVASIAAMVSRRTVYSIKEIENMATRPTKVILFRLIRHFPTPPVLNRLLKDGVVAGNIQSITKISNDAFSRVLAAAGA